MRMPAPPRPSTHSRAAAGPWIAAFLFSSAALLGAALLAASGSGSPSAGEGGEAARQAQEEAHPLSTAAAAVDFDHSAAPLAVLLLIKLRPSKGRTKADVQKATKAWGPARDWGLHLQGPADLSVVDNNAVVITCANEADALQVKDWLLAKQESVYEVELSPGERTFRRPGDVPIEVLRQELARAAKQERRKQGWAWIREEAKKQGLTIKLPPRRKRVGLGGGGAGSRQERRGRQKQLPNSRGEL